MTNTGAQALRWGEAAKKAGASKHQIAKMLVVSPSAIRCSTWTILSKGTPTMLDTTPVTTEITRLISTGTTEQALLAAVSYLFPNRSPAELQEVTAKAERQATRRH
jgi:hypothetical protein